jgi:hypothetical protein
LALEWKFLEMNVESKLGRSSGITRPSRFKRPVSQTPGNLMQEVIRIGPTHRCWLSSQRIMLTSFITSVVAAAKPRLQIAVLVRQSWAFMHTTERRLCGDQLTPAVAALFDLREEFSLSCIIAKVLEWIDWKGLDFPCAGKRGEIKSLHFSDKNPPRRIPNGAPGLQ